LFHLELLGGRNSFDLGGDDGKGSERDTVELIEATPKTRLADTLEDLGHITELMLTRAVGYDDEDTEGTTQVLDGLSLTGTGGTSGCTTVAHAEGLSKSDVAPLGEGSDTKSLFGTEELVLIGEVDISDRDNGLAFFTLFCFPVEAGVLLPIEVLDISDFLIDHVIPDSSEEILLVDLNGDERLNLSSDEFVGKVVTGHSG
jgi:hypothetical protein